MKRLLAFVASTAALLASGSAFPCGAAFGPSVTIDPKQDLILAWSYSAFTYRIGVALAILLGSLQ